MTSSLAVPPTIDDDDGSGGGWWSRSPGWAKVVVAGGTVLILLLLGALVGAVLGRSTAASSGPPAGSIDVAYLQDMSTHHRQAVEMAVWERSNTTDPELRQLAFDIESSQTMQVGSMEGWLTLWDQPTSPPSGHYMGWMGMVTPTMPGMASPADLASFRSLSGRALDVDFLQLMLRHHQGGIPMLQAAVARAQVPAVQTLSESMLRAQTAEAQTMTQMLSARGAAPLPAPTMMGG